MSDSDSTVPNGFRVIPGFPRYAINEHGTVLSTCPRNGRGKQRPWTNASQLALVADSDGYLCINLYRNGRMQQMRVHALVLTIFVGPCPDGLQCRHLDGNKTNNHVSNLAWGTSHENHLDKATHGTIAKGERNGRSKLTNEDVAEIRKRRANGEMLETIAHDFSVSKGTVSHVAIGRKWKHV